MHMQAHIEGMAAATETIGDMIEEVQHRVYDEDGAWVGGGCT